MTVQDHGPTGILRLNYRFNWIPRRVTSAYVEGDAAVRLMVFKFLPEESDRYNSINIEE
jgi:hypothetical protein